MLPAYIADLIGQKNAGTIHGAVSVVAGGGTNGLGVHAKSISA